MFRPQSVARLVAILFALMAIAAPATRADVFTNVPEAAGYNLVYTFPIPNDSAGWNGVAVPYTVNNAASIADNSFSRVGYYMEVQATAPGSPLQYVYASMNADGLSRQAGKLGVPTTASGAFFQQRLTSLNVVSNFPGIVNGTGIATGNIEFWPSNYGQGNGAGVPNASDGTFDFGDSGADLNAGHGSMQIHNYDLDGAGAGTAGQTLFAYNAWGGARRSEFGIGSQVGGSGNPDWTFNTDNITTYSVKTLQVVVGGAALPPPPPPPPPGPTYMPLGDSITEGAGGVGGYRSRLHQNLSAADPSRNPDFVGSATNNASSTLLSSGEANHEGHGGYTINQINANLDGNDGAGGNNGGFWLTGTGARGPENPDFITLHIGTNDISGGASAAVARDRLEALVDKIVALRPNAKLLVASLIRRADGNEGTNVAYNAFIEQLVGEHRALGENVFFVDMHPIVPLSEIPDGIHPNDAGYARMGDAWFAAIQAIPEPSGLSVLLLCGVALGARRRTRVGG